MFSKIIDCFEFPTNLGLRRNPQGIAPGTNRLPQLLKQYGLYDQLNPQTISQLPAPNYEMSFHRKTEILNQEIIKTYARKQAEMIRENRNPKHFNLFLGGDCSILLGSALALKQSGRFGLFFLDGHTDYTTPKLSGTKAVAGMDLALVTGLGEASLTNIDGLVPYFEEQHVFCVGNREYDKEYIEPILHSAIQYVDLMNLRKIGISNIIQQFTDMVSQQPLDGFLIHLDVDVLHDSIMPAVDSRQADGLYYQELRELLQPLIQHEKAIGIDIAILDPNMDPDGTYTKQFVEEVAQLFHKAK